MWKPRKPLIFGLSAAFFRPQTDREIFRTIVDALFNIFPQLHNRSHIYPHLVHILPLVPFLSYVEDCGKLGRIF